MASSSRMAHSFFMVVPPSGYARLRAGSIRQFHTKDSASDAQTDFSSGCSEGTQPYLLYGKELMGNLAEKMQADGVLSRQAAFVRHCLYYTTLCIELQAFAAGIADIFTKVRQDATGCD